jgi:hypothetical protein
MAMLPPSSLHFILNMEASGTLVSCHTTRRNEPEDFILNLHSRENIKRFFIVVVYKLVDPIIIYSSFAPHGA